MRDIDFFKYYKHRTTNKFNIFYNEGFHEYNLLMSMQKNWKISEGRDKINGKSRGLLSPKKIDIFNIFLCKSPILVNCTVDYI